MVQDELGQHGGVLLREGEMMLLQIRSGSIDSDL